MSARIIYTAFAFMLTAAVTLPAQEPISFEQFAKQIDPYFLPELVNDVRQELPKTPFQVWVYDVGDFTGDGIYDLVLTIRKNNDTRRNIEVYFFVDDQGVLMPVRHEVISFVELPIEVGTSIDNGNAYTLRKLKEFHWEMTGYRYRDGVVMLVEKFITEPHGRMVREHYRNFQNLDSWQRYLTVPDGDSVFRSQFLTVPSYTRGRDVSSGYTSTATADHSRYLADGIYYWRGEKDASASVRSAYDPEFLYFNILVQDDQVITGGADPADTAVERLELWLDMNLLGDRFQGHAGGSFRFQTDTNIYAFHITLGDFIEQPAMIRTASSNVMDRTQTEAARRLKVVSIRNDEGYALKARIPWQLLGYPEAPIIENELAEFGMTLLLHDIDNRYRPDEVSTISTGLNFDPTKPATFGALILVPENMHYGHSENIFVGDVKERLEEVGF